MSAAELAEAIGMTLKDAVVFLDTNVFLVDMDSTVWDALCARQIFITPDVWTELLPWLKTPTNNKLMRDRVIAAVTNQAKSSTSSGVSVSEDRPGEVAKIEVLFLNEDFTNHGYEYYFRLLALRKMTGPVVHAVMTKNLGRSPTTDEFAAEVQKYLGPRGLLLAKKGLEAATSQNKLTDEQLVVMGALTGIMRGREVLIVTRDADVFEQYFKTLNLMKEHYRAMLIAERYASNPESVPFREVPITNDSRVMFSGSSVLEFVTTDVEFNPLPAKFHFVNIYCVLLGGGPSKMVVSWCSFCAETEMAQMLKVKTATRGLNTARFDGRNCTIYTAPLTPENHKVVVTIGKEQMHSLGNLGNIGQDDYQNALFENELTTRYSYRD
jgi:hypothetical protein